MHLDHANIVTPDLEPTAGFFTQVLGFTVGPRPDFLVPGYWLYTEGVPVIHLTQSTLPLPTVRTTPRVDHVAFRVASREEWSRVLDRLKAHNIDYQLNDGDGSGDTQLWVAIATGVVIELMISND